MSCGGSAPCCPASALCPGAMTCPRSHRRTVPPVPWQCHAELCLVLSPFPAGADEDPGVPVPCPVRACAWQAAELPGGAGCHTGTSRGSSSSQRGGTGVPPLSAMRCLRHPIGVRTPHGEEHARVSTVSPQVSCQLEKTLVTLQNNEAQLEKLTVANSRLGKGRGGRHGGWICPIPMPLSPLADNPVPRRPELRDNKAGQHGAGAGCAAAGE